MKPTALNWGIQKAIIAGNLVKAAVIGKAEVEKSVICPIEDTESHHLSGSIQPPGKCAIHQERVAVADTHGVLTFVESAIGLKFTVLHDDWKVVDPVGLRHMQ